MPDWIHVGVRTRWMWRGWGGCVQWDEKCFDSLESAGQGVILLPVSQRSRKIQDFLFAKSQVTFELALPHPMPEWPLCPVRKEGSCVKQRIQRGAQTHTPASWARALSSVYSCMFARGMLTIVTPFIKGHTRQSTSETHLF